MSLPNLFSIMLSGAWPGLKPGILALCLTLLSEALYSLCMISAGISIFSRFFVLVMSSTVTLKCASLRFLEDPLRQDRRESQCREDFSLFYSLVTPGKATWNTARLPFNVK